VKYVTDYFWVVVCTNHRFHHKENVGYEHKVMLRETDAFSSLPLLPDKIDVRCDSCGEEHSYKLKEVMRDEVPVPKVFVPHPLFKSVWFSVTVMPQNLIERHSQREQNLRPVVPVV
jgi:hypothetical protein